MRCLAIWYKRKPGERRGQKLKLELHINLWKLKCKKGSAKGKDSKQFLDIGLKVFGIKKARELKIYLPFKILKREIMDLGGRLSKELVGAVFNADLSITETTNSKVAKITDKKGVPQFNIYSIDTKNDIKVPKKYEGSIIRMDVNKILPDEPIYYRIRINSSGLDKFNVVYMLKSSWLEHFSTNTELVDFRVNEKRNLGDTLLEEMNREDGVVFKDVDFFVMREFTYDYVSSIKELHRSRLLEEDVWQLYVGDDYDCSKIIAYQLKWEKKDKDIIGFNAFIKYKFLESNWKTIGRFICILIGIGLVGGFLATLIGYCLID